MYWLRYLLKDPFRSLQTSRNREFVKLLIKYGDLDRHKEHQVKFDNYKVTAPDVMSFLWQFKEIFADRFYHFESANSEPVILDCGANIGMSILYFKKIFPQSKIIAFEADPAINVLLKLNLLQNNITDVELVPKAVWKDCNGILFGSETSDASSIYLNSVKHKIESVRLKDYLETQKEIDFLKIDIEGSEMEVLEDCRKSLNNVNNLFVEFHSYLGNPQGLGNIVQIIEENGFRYFIDTNQHRDSPFTNYKYPRNESMDLQLNIFAWREILNDILN